MGWGKVFLKVVLIDIGRWLGWGETGGPAACEVLGRRLEARAARQAVPLRMERVPEPVGLDEVGSAGSDGCLSSIRDSQWAKRSFPLSRGEEPTETQRADCQLWRGWLRKLAGTK